MTTPEGKEKKIDEDSLSTHSDAQQPVLLELTSQLSKLSLHMEDIQDDLKKVREEMRSGYTHRILQGFP
jgi:hypothetical protein